ncbi:MAG TPA: hypothetical protein VMK42_06480 [Anaeromyxobacteraceae bacterium]|nr:hypothetical protein [Anaeromyxobacteraceae bacterium]
MVLGEAVKAAQELRDALAAEVEEARGERNFFRTLDAGALLSRARARAHFNCRIARLEETLHGALKAAAAELGIDEVTTASFAAREPEGAKALSRAFAEIRSLSAAMAELDRLNQFLAKRALRVVTSYVEAIAPSPSTYDRRGLRAAAARRAMVSSRV